MRRRCGRGSGDAFHDQRGWRNLLCAFVPPVENLFRLNNARIHRRGTKAQRRFLTRVRSSFLYRCIIGSGFAPGAIATAVPRLSLNPASRNPVSYNSTTVLVWPRSLGGRPTSTLTMSGRWHRRRESASAQPSDQTAARQRLTPASSDSGRCRPCQSPDAIRRGSACG